MLAKIWKKVLLAICIIACIYNVMHKLVSRTSLETQLKSVEGGTSIMDVFKKDKKKAVPPKNEAAEENVVEKKQIEKKVDEEETNIEENENQEDNAIVVVYQ